MQSGELRFCIMNAIIFDLDGTLVDTTALVVNTYVETIRTLGGVEVTTGDVLANFNIGPTSVLLNHFLGRPIVPQDLDVYFGVYEAAIATLQPFAGVVDMLTQLRMKGNRLGLYTTATRRAVHLILPKTNLDAYFDLVVAGDEVTRPKPDPEGLQQVCQKLGVQTRDAAYIGDAEADLLCANSANAVAIHAAWATAPVQFAGRHFIAQQPLDVVGLVERMERPRVAKPTSSKGP